MAKVPVNSEILKWAREELNMTIDEVANRMKKDEDSIIAWEEGLDFPTYAQLEKLAYEIYKIPLAVFFFPEHPDLAHTQKSFRTLTNEMYNSIPSNIIKLFRKAEVLKENLYELSENDNSKYKNTILVLTQKNNYSEIIKELRNILGVNLDEQKKWKDSKQALTEWRDRFEKIGIYIFKDAFKNDFYSGFCLYDDIFPIIYINNSMSTNRQIFTIFHEFWHIYSKTSGIDNRNDNDEYFASLEKDGLDIEIKCNKFAGDFLVPNDDFELISKDLEINEKSISDLADIYNVSREVILRKFYDRKKVDQYTYEFLSSSWINDSKRLNENKPGGSYYNNILSYLGDGYLGKVYSSYYKNRISEVQLADYLNVKINSLNTIEGILNRRWQGD